MPKFFVSAEDILGGQIVLRGQNAAHLKSLRLREGEALCISDDTEREYACVFQGLRGGEGLAEIRSVGRSAAEPQVTVSVYAALPKGDKTETIVQKAVELGAARIVFFLSSRCVARPDERALKKRLERLSRVSEEAAMQSYRGRIPAVEWLPSFAAMAAQAAASGLALFLWEDERQRSLKAALQASPATEVALVTGPEGGFSREEAQQAEAAGLLPVTLGRRILRCETAPLCALSAVMYERNSLE